MNTPNVGPKPAFFDQLGIDGCLKWENDAAFLADTLQIVQPRNILETGFFQGASSSMWLHLSDATLTSVDPMINLYDPAVKHDGKPENAEKLKNHFPGRFTFLQKDSRAVRPDLAGQKFDLFFIDGDHLDTGIRNDLQIAIDLEIPWILVDDFVTNVLDIYLKEFTNEFFVVRVYPRKDFFQGAPIPIVLLRRFNRNILARLNGKP